jgi:hypothetical protein
MIRMTTIPSLFLAAAWIAAAIVAVVCGFSSGAVAQNAQVWSDIDCAQSPIVAPAGLRCRATNEINGSSDARFSKGSGGGIFKSWATYGTKDGVKLYYLIYDTIGPHSSKTVFRQLDEEIKSLSQYAKGGKDFTPPAPMNGADYSRFVGAGGDACVAVRKVGPVQGSGFKWVLFANECVRAGKTISDQEVGRFIAATGYRS